MRKKLFVLVFTIIVLSINSCSMESAFPDEKLDNYWRLDIIEYKDGVNFWGDSCQSEVIENTMFGFARHIVIIEDISREFERHGITTRIADSIKMDFSIYNDNDLINSLRFCGLDSVVSTFKIEYPSSKRMVLTNMKVVLRFRMW